MLNKFTFEEIESGCKHKLTTLEHWLRRLIDDTLSNEFGDYFHYTDENGNYIIKNQLLNLQFKESKESQIDIRG